MPKINGKWVDEAEANRQFVKACGGKVKQGGGCSNADRLQQIWKMSYPHGLEGTNSYVSKGDDFKRQATASGFSDRLIKMFLELP